MQWLATPNSPFWPPASWPIWATRDDYIAALRAADGGDFIPLFLFARS
jgi:hypothetical protein